VFCYFACIVYLQMVYKQSLCFPACLRYPCITSYQINVCFCQQRPQTYKNYDGNRIH
jgi:hypothetical protein